MVHGPIRRRPASLVPSRSSYTASDGTLSASSTASLDLIAAAPTLAIVNTILSVVEETGTVALGISETPFNPTDTVYVSITGVPADATLTSAADPAGISYDSGTHTWTVAAGALADLTFNAGEEATATLNITATSSGAFGATSAPQTISLTVSPVAENPVFGGSVATSAAEQGGVVTLGATVAAFDADDGAVSVTITGLANDLSTFNGGTYTAATGTWTGTAAQFNALTFHAGENGTQNLTITASTTGAEAGSSSESYTLTVNPVAENPVLARCDSATVSEGGLVTLGVTDSEVRRRRHAGHGDDHRTAWRSEQLQRRHLQASTGTWTGTAAQFKALTFTAGETRRRCTITRPAPRAASRSDGESYTLTVSPVAENPMFGAVRPRRRSSEGGAGDAGC